ncbi:hypothetical protein NX786_12030 [Telluria mixta]|uniref:Uncharacterized protein n=1 Tax=Telluria mixta TaxID=34071 RepID=A0ABT2BYP8_9BURK|nr:hypothetical protein [Telluria mixta]MCS0630062.1 hypothetical protein [Telluria mixta]WEM94625.1 hypothetical protein P0M04_24475 [Telluria mixta]
MKILTKPARAALDDVTDAVSDTAGLLQQSGRLEPGYGLASGALAFFLAVLCFLGVLVFHFPQ